MPDHFQGSMTFKLTMRVRGNVTPEFVAEEITASLVKDGYSPEAFDITPIEEETHGSV